MLEFTCFLEEVSKNGESIGEALIRELKEELGMIVDISDREPDLVVDQLIKNYIKRNDKGTTNRLMTTYYYIIFQNEIIQKSKISLSLDEIKHKFKTLLVPLSDISKFIADNKSDNPRYEYFSRELLSVIDMIRETKN